MGGLDSRLALVASLVRPGNVVADVGTDHAYLPVWLTEKGICPSVIASDINAGPLAAAEAHVTRAGLTDKISLRLGDGLRPVAPGEARDIVIAGMGGETIAAILQDAAWVKNPDIRLILQPMTRAEELRRWLLTGGFAIEEEHLAQEGRHLYPVLAAVYTGAEPETDPLAWYGGAFTPDEGRPYRHKVAQTLRRRCAGLRKTAGEDALREAEKLEELANRLDGLCEE